MTNLREELLNLLVEAEKKSRYGRAIAGSTVYASPEVQQAEEERLANLENEEAGVEDTNKDEISLDSHAFRLLCIEALNNSQCLKRLEPALGADFSSSTKINPSFTAGINYVVSFYADVVDCFNNRKITGKVKTAIDSLQEATYIKKNDDAVKQLTKLFTNPSETRKLQEAPYEDMVDDITDLCVAAHIINWTRILTYQTSGNKQADTDLMALKDIFKAPGENNKSNKMFVSNLSDTELDKFYSKENPNVFAEYLEQFSWGRRGNLNEAISNNVQGDLGTATGDNEVFLLNCLISYLIDILKTGTPHPSIIFNAANAMSIQNAKSGSMYEVSRIESLEKPTNTNQTGKYWDEGPELDDPDYNQGVSNPELGKFEGEKTTQDDIESPDLVAMEAFKDYVEEIKLENNWTPNNTFSFLSRTLKTKEGADGLSAILKRTFTALPGTVYDTDFTFPVVADNKIQYVNLLTRMRTLTLSSNFINIIANLASVTANMPVYKEAEIKLESYIKAQFDNLNEAVKETKTGMTPEDINQIIEKLPKTLEEALAAYTISRAKGTGYSIIEYKNQAVKDVNRLYKILLKHFPMFNEMSPNELTPVPPDGLVAGSKLQSSLGITVVPNVEVAATGITAQERSKGQIAVRGKDEETLEALWHVYYTAIKDIIDPTLNVSSWGLLTPTRLGKLAIYGVLFNTVEVPVGSTSDNGNRIKALFRSKSEFSTVRDRVLHTVAALKDKFLSVKTESEVVNLLQEILASFGQAQQIKFFSSPATQTCPENKKSTLAQLIDPSIAITPALRTVFRTHTYSEQHKISNPFTDLISSAIVLNNKTTNEAIINSNKLVLLEAEENTYELIACYAAVNTQIRARILLAVASLMDLLENILIVLREIITSLKTVLTHLFAEDVAGGRADKFFKDVSDVLVSVVPKAGVASPEDLKSDIVGKLQVINDRFAPSEVKAKKVSALREPTPWSGKLYGAIE